MKTQAQKADFVMKRIRHFRNLSLGKCMCISQWRDDKLERYLFKQKRYVTEQKRYIAKRKRYITGRKRYLSKRHDISPRNKIALTIYRSIFHLR